MTEVDVLLLRFDAPLLSFGGVAVDENRVTREFPAASMITGLLANALGWDHGDFDRLQRLQDRSRYAVRRDRQGQALVDFHTVDLSQDFMQEGWTTRGKPEGRGGASAGGTHIRKRHFWADALFTVALTLEPAGEEPTVADLEEALRYPARPLFLGRKCCVPSQPILLRRQRAASPAAALLAEPAGWRSRAERRRQENAPADATLWWTGEDPPGHAALRTYPVTDERLWRHQIHAGSRQLKEALVPLPAADDSENSPSA